jgi:ubiquinone/menaquinone biosynthesis C-methylase UbiE
MDRGMIGRLRRPPTLDMESYQELVTGLRRWVNGPFRQAAADEADEIYGDLMLAPGDNRRAETRETLQQNPVIATRNRVWASVQQMTWKNVIDTLWKDPDVFLKELEDADDKGPGRLVLNPTMDIPEYAKHEIHLQPGGYMGDDLGGYVYYWGTNNFYEGKVYQDDYHRELAASLSVPEDGQVKRILDLGCGIGRVSIAIAERFPDAEVWGIDYGPALLRFGHKRAIDLGVEVNFAQMMAENLDFADNSFDIVTSYILFHEVPTSVAERIYREAYRVLRPGGVWEFFDFKTGKREQKPYDDLGRWIDHVFNAEVWSAQYISSDPMAAMEKIGFAVEPPTPRHMAVHAYKAVKPAA